MMKSIYISSCVPDGGVWRCGFDGETLSKRDFSPVGRVMYTARESDTIYAVALEPDSLESFVVQAKLTDGRPGTFGGRIRTGRESCFIDVRDGDFYTADYSSAGVTKNGARTVTHTGCGSDPSRQEAPHPHQALLSPDGRYVLVCDLGLDRVFVYDRELTLVSQADAPKGQGIRHLVFAPDGKQVYAVNELGCSVTEFRWSDGELTALRTTPFPCAGKSYAGAVRLSENGDLLFISLRGDDTIAVYAREEKGLRLLRSFPCGGCWPRDFAVCGDRLLVANERSGNVCAMDFYGEIKSEISVPAPLCVMV